MNQISFKAACLACCLVWGAGLSVANAQPAAPWSDKAYQPDRIDKYLLLREGLASADRNVRASPIHGTSTCDAVFLFSAVANKPLTATEMEICALQLFEVQKNTVGDRRDLNDAFVKKEVIDQFSKVALNRIEEFKKSKFFYMHAPDVEIDQFNIQNYTIKMRVDLGLTSWSRYLDYYLFDGPGMMKGNRVHWYQAGMGGYTAETAREVESARVSGRFRPKENIVKFEVLGATEMGPGEQAGNRRIKIDVKALYVPYTDSKGQNQILGFVE